MKNDNSYPNLAYQYLLYEFIRLNSGSVCVLSTFFFICEVIDALLLTGKPKLQLILILGLSSIFSYFICLYFVNLREKVGLKLAHLKS